jgi:hypothetical protein
MKCLETTHCQGNHSESASIYFFPLTILKPSDMRRICDQSGQPVNGSMARHISQAAGHNREPSPSLQNFPTYADMDHMDMTDDGGFETRGFDDTWANEAAMNAPMADDDVAAEEYNEQMFPNAGMHISRNN